MNCPKCGEGMTQTGRTTVPLLPSARLSWHCKTCGVSGNSSEGSDEISTKTSTMEALPRPQDLVGTFRRFGYSGPVYEVLKVVSTDDGVVELHVVIPETGEELNVSYVQVLQDLMYAVAFTRLL